MELLAVIEALQSLTQPVEVLPEIVKGHLVADLVAILASVDIVLGDIDR